MPLHATISIRLVGHSELANAIRKYAENIPKPEPTGKVGRPRKTGIKQLASMADVNRCTLESWLTGKRSMSLQDLQSVAKVIGYEAKIM